MTLRIVEAFAAAYRRYHYTIVMAVCAGIALGMLIVAVHVLRGHH